jgi:BASS family bile acid:Na+ symporter
MRLALKLLTSSAFMMAAALIISLVTNFSGFYKDFLLPNGFTTNITSNLTIFLLAVMMTISLSRIPSRNLSPTENPLALARGIAMGVFIASIVPIIGYLLLKDTSYGDYAKGLVFVAATPFAASVAPLSFILRGDMEHACRTTIYGYIVSLAWIPIIVFILLGTTVNMKDLVITVIECVGIPLVVSRLFTNVKMNKTIMAVVLNCIIGFLVWMSVSSTSFPGGPNAVAVVAIFLLIGAFRTFGFGNAVEVIEKRMGIGWSQRVTDILTMSYKNKGIAIALCVSTMGPLVPVAMVAIALSVVMETLWVVFMDSVLFTKKRMKRELEKEGLEVGDL